MRRTAEYGLARYALPVGTAGFLASLLVACDGRGNPSPQVGRPAPAYSAVTLAGDSIRLSDLRGDVVLLNVWATWCHPCREEIPALEALHAEYADDGLRVIGVSVDDGGLEDAERVKAFATEFGATYAIWADPGQEVARTFFTIGVPTTVLIGRDGTLLWRHTGPIRAGDPALARQIREALGSSPSAETTAARH